MTDNKIIVNKHVQYQGNQGVMPLRILADTILKRDLGISIEQAEQFLQRIEAALPTHPELEDLRPLLKLATQKLEQINNIDILVKKV